MVDLKVSPKGEGFNPILQTLIYDDNFTGKVKTYYKDIYNCIIDINSNEVESILHEFQKKEGYSTKILENYILKLDNKELNIQCMVNLVEDEFLYYDIQNVTGANLDSIMKIINSLALNKSTNSFEYDIFSIDNRIFRTPIIMIGHYYILSHFLLMEALHYLKYRILKKKLSNDGGLTKKIEKKYDEKELVDLKLLINQFEVTGDIRFKLDSINEFKHLFMGKGVTKEIDFYFIYDKTLYIMEYKNQDIDRNIYEISKTYNRNKDNKDKLLRMVNIIKKNLVLFENYIGKEISEVKSFLVFKYKCSFPFFYMGDEVYTCYYEDFYDWCKKLIKDKDS